MVLNKQSGDLISNGKSQPINDCLHQLFEAQADKSPSAPAIDEGGTILTTKDLAQEKVIGVADVICVDLQDRQIALESSVRFDRNVIGTTDRDLSYVIYTSGSTGRPKGVEIEHRSSNNYIRVVNESVYHIQSTDRVYQGFSIAFDASVEEMWCTFASSRFDRANSFWGRFSHVSDPAAGDGAILRSHFASNDGGRSTHNSVIDFGWRTMSPRIGIPLV